MTTIHKNPFKNNCNPTERLLRGCHELQGTTGDRLNYLQSGIHRLQAGLLFGATSVAVRLTETIQVLIY